MLTNHRHRAQALKIVLQVVISLLIVYHLLAIAILSNSGSFLGRKYSRYLTPYANQLGFHNMWNFYSPDPANAMVFEYSVSFLNSEGDEVKESIHRKIPGSETEMVLNSAERRLLYVTRYFLINPNLVKEFFGPWVCRKHAGASRVIASLTIYTQPSLDKAMLESEETLSSMIVPRDVFREELPCAGEVP